MKSDKLDEIRWGMMLIEVTSLITNCIYTGHCVKIVTTTISTIGTVLNLIILRILNINNNNNIFYYSTRHCNTRSPFYGARESKRWFKDHVEGKQ